MRFPAYLPDSDEEWQKVEVKRNRPVFRHYETAEEIRARKAKRNSAKDSVKPTDDFPTSGEGFTVR